MPTSRTAIAINIVHSTFICWDIIFDIKGFNLCSTQGSN